MLYTALIEKSALNVSIPPEQHGKSNFAPNKDNLHCNYCGKSRHTTETCWKLHGKATKGRGGKRINITRGQANMTEAIADKDGHGLSADEIQHFRRILSHLDTSTSASSNFVKSGNISSHPDSWIVASGANRHMTGNSKGFLNYTPCITKDSVKIADGSLTSISGTGSVVCTPDIKLSFVLYIPDFPINLLSVNAIIKDLNCKGVFLS